MFEWTDAAIAELRKCVDFGWSAKRVALHIGEHFDGSPSRNAIIGKALRLKLQWQNAPGPRLPSQQRQRTPRKPKPNWSPRGHQAPQPPTHVFTGDPAEIPERQRRTILTLGNEHCRYPYGDVGRPDFFFCGAPEADCGAGRAYCSAHSRLAYQRRTA